MQHEKGDYSESGDIFHIIKNVREHGYTTCLRRYDITDSSLPEEYYNIDTPQWRKHELELQCHEILYKYIILGYKVLLSRSAGSEDEYIVDSIHNNQNQWVTKFQFNLTLEEAKTSFNKEEDLRYKSYIRDGKEYINGYILIYMYYTNIEFEKMLLPYHYSWYYEM